MVLAIVGFSYFYSTKKRKIFYKLLTLTKACLLIKRTKKDIQNN